MLFRGKTEIRHLGINMLIASLLFAGFAVRLQGEDSKGTAVTTPPTATELPSAKKIYDDYIDAIGGRAAMEKIQTSRIVGEFSVVGTKGKLVMYKSRPNKMSVEVEMGGDRKAFQGTNGEIAWEVAPSGTGKLLEGEAKEEIFKQADFDQQLNVDKYYKSRTCVAQEDVDGKPCYKVECVTMNGKKESQFYEVESKFLVLTISSQKLPIGSANIEAHLSDYRPAGELMLPYMTTVNMLSAKQVVTLLEVEYNIQIPDTKFAPPAPIAKLLQEKRQ